MASPCELLCDSASRDEADALLARVAQTAWSVEDKFSRYRDDNVVHRINTSDGRAVTVDDETARLLDFATTLYRLSKRRFDITSGVLRRIWHFDGSDRIPPDAAVDEVLPRVGWHRVRWENPALTLEPGMEIDFGGIGKEYAVDRCAELCRSATEASCVVNFGGDLAVSRPRRNRRPWRVGVETAGGAPVADRLIDIVSGGMATSGDSRRYLLRDGIRYSHILDPTTGRPVVGAPHSVTVVAQSCTQAGMLATLASLEGAGAEAFLDAQGVLYRTQR